MLVSNSKTHLLNVSLRSKEWTHSSSPSSGFIICFLNIFYQAFAEKNDVYWLKICFEYCTICCLLKKANMWFLNCESFALLRIFHRPLYVLIGGQYPGTSLSWSVFCVLVHCWYFCGKDQRTLRYWIQKYASVINILSKLYIHMYVLPLF